MRSTPLSWDIFCTVIDNFGDIGVCWRLARQCVIEHNLQVRLWVDDLASFARIQPQINPVLDEQCWAGVTICRWRDPFPLVKPAEVVIEAFACHLPVAYLAGMQTSKPVWINLEYLSAEDWVEGCHQLPSPQMGLQKYFYFPGFTERTGGVLGEASMRAEKAVWSEQDRMDWLATLHVPFEPSATYISLFAYENPALTELLAQWIASDSIVHVLLPEGRLLPQVTTALGVPDLQPVLTLQRGALRVTRLPMLTQKEYDHLLWSCDVNFVRGEDSFVRAQWAELPFVWHIYPQHEGAHQIKLEAFMDRYCEHLDGDSARALRDFWRAWNLGYGADAAWPAFVTAIPTLREHAKDWSKRLAANGDLAGNLVKFVLGKVQ